MDSLKKIVIADDEEGICLMLKSFLEFHGFSVKTFPNGLKAFDYLTQHHADLLLVDVFMPGLDGLTLIKELKKNEKPLPPTIFMTGNDEVSHAEYYKHGASKIISKPFTAETIVSEVVDFFEKV